MTAMQNDWQYGTYRCPVCGHRDATELESERGSRIVECSYCGKQFLHEKDRLHHVREENEKKVDARRHKF